MGFSVEYSGVVVAQFFYHVTLLLVTIKAFFSSLLRVLRLSGYLSDDDLLNHYSPSLSSSPSSSASVSAAAIKQSLPVVTFASLEENIAGGSGNTMTCAVCLNEFKGKDKVRELSHVCRHVFHKRCLDGWLDHEQKTCPLCRSSLTMPPLAGRDCDQRPETSWCVERLLYLFGDDLLSA